MFGFFVCFCPFLSVVFLSQDLFKPGIHFTLSLEANRNEKFGDIHLNKDYTRSDDAPDIIYYGHSNEDIGNNDYATTEDDLDNKTYSGCFYYM